jgi:hypothetical protein
MGLVETAGYYQGLKAGFEALGVPCRFADLSFNRFGYGGQDNPWTVRLARWAYHRYLGAMDQALWRKLPWFVGHQVARLPLFIDAVARSDVFIFGFNASFFRHRELPLLRWLGKTVIFQYHGSDSRPPLIDGPYWQAPGATAASCRVHTRRKRDELAWIDRHAHVVVDTPPQGLLRQRPFVNWLKIGLPSRPQTVPDDDALQAAWQRTLTSAGVRILHSPSAPEIKGTAAIREAIGRLQAKGHVIDYIELKGLPNAVVLEELARCDFVVDQLYADYGMAGFATEAAWFGKPAVVGGYQAVDWPRWLLPEELPPTVYVQPDALEAAIEHLIVDRAACVEAGRRCRTFVETRWSPQAVAGRYLQLIGGDVPEGWWVTLEGLTDFYGCGQPRDRLLERLRAYLQREGTDALCLDDKPGLRDRLVAFAQAEAVSL